MKKILISCLLFIIASDKSYAWDGTVTNTIAKLDVVESGNNYGFRVYLSGYPTLCGNANNWAYVNKSDDNYEVMVSTLLAAHLGGKTITIYTNRNASGYCHIGYLTLR